MFKKFQNTFVGFKSVSHVYKSVIENIYEKISYEI